ncbi:MAG: DUF4157 domain-containing protein [Ilumatobacteraceae bacterium]
MGTAPTRTVSSRERGQQDGPALVSHERSTEARDPRTVLGNRSVRTLLAQRRLAVGSSSDPLEVEADRVAADVVRTLAVGPAPDHECGQGCSVHGSRPQLSRAIRRAPAHPHDAPIGAAGGSVQAADEAAVNRARGGGTSLPEDFRARVEPIMGADFSGIRVHTGKEATQLNRSFGASAFTIGSDIFFRQGLPDVHTGDGARLVTHELAHTIQQGAATVARTHDVGQLPHGGPTAAGGPAARAQRLESPSPSGDIQRKFGFEIELPVLLTKEANRPVTSVADGSTINMANVPGDPALTGPETHLMDLDDGYINVDHSRTLNKLFESDLGQYATDNNLNPNATASLKAHAGNLMPSGASIVEVVTDAWDEQALNRAQALAKVRSVIADVTDLYNHIAGDSETYGNNGYRFGSNAPGSSTFQPRLGYFHATYGIKLSQVPKLFEKTTKQKKALKKYAQTNAPEKEHAENVELTSQAVSAAKAAMREIKRIWPRVVVTRKVLPDTDKVAMSSASEKEFLGFLTLLANYFMLMKAHVGGDDLGKKLLGMHYYKSDMYDVATQLPADITGPLQAADPRLHDEVVDAICEATGVDRTDGLGGGLGGKTVLGYCRQIFRGQFGTIKEGGVDKLDASGDTFMDPVLAGTINPWSSKLGPAQLGPTGRKGLGVVMENRHLEYLNPEYGDLVDAQQQTMRDEATQYGPPKAGVDARTADAKRMYESIAAREEGPGRRPIAEWETMMMNIYDMVRTLNRKT